MSALEKIESNKAAVEFQRPHHALPELMIPKALATALTKAQRDMNGAKKDSTNPHFKSKYADLESVVLAVREAFGKHGLAFLQRFAEAENGIRVETLLVHESGESWSNGVLFVPVSRMDAQGFGSAITYARRYSLQTAAGIAPEDDDGNAASAAPPPKKVAGRQIGGTGVIKPSDGAWESLSEASKSKVMDLYTVLSEYCEQGDYDAAAGELQDAVLEAEEKVALWAKFGSKDRTAMTKAIEAMKYADVPQ